MNIVILAAGQGTRLRPLTDTLPKCLVEINGKSILERQLEVINKMDFESKVIVAGFQSRKLMNYGCEVVINEQYEETNMVFSLLCAKNYFNDDVIIAYGDIVYESQIMEHLKGYKSDRISVVIDKEWKTYWEERFENPLSDAESLLISEGKIVDIGRKVEDYSNIQGQYIGLLKFPQNVMAKVQILFEQLGTDSETIERVLGKKKSSQQLYMTDLLQILIDKGFQIEPVYTERGWFEVDSLDDLKIAEKYLI